MTTAIPHTESIKDYYEKILKSTHDLKTSACCTLERLPDYMQDIMASIDGEILEKFYGCGSPIPWALEGARVLDLGCGSGRDVYLLSKLVGEQGFITGVDMSHEQLAVAQKHLLHQTQKFGYHRPNIDFKHGYIEDLRSLNITDQSQDVVVSNCVINLSLDKHQVFSEIFRVLKNGGELLFSDVFADRRIPKHFSQDPVLLGECLAGAMYIEDFRRLLATLGCPDFRIISQHPITIHHPEIAAKIGMIHFTSLTIRAFRLSRLEDRCEDYGQTATYQGTIPHHPHRLILDPHHIFETDRPLRVCANTAAMIQESRLAKHFLLQGDRSKHFGLFPGCGTENIFHPGLADKRETCC